MEKLTDKQKKIAVIVVAVLLAIHFAPGFIATCVVLSQVRPPPWFKSPHRRTLLRLSPLPLRRPKRRRRVSMAVSGQAVS
jgi:hypothetical protein